MGTANGQTLTIGSPSTGNISLYNFPVGILHTDANGVLSSSTLNLAGGPTEITGILPVTNGGSPFEETSGAITQRITTEDLLLGATSTSSAKFAFSNVGNGTPTASISGTGNNALSFTGNGTIGTTNGQSLTLGTTGNINFFSSANVLDTAGNLTLAGPLGITETGNR